MDINSLKNRHKWHLLDRNILCYLCYFTKHFYYRINYLETTLVSAGNNDDCFHQKEDTSFSKMTKAMCLLCTMDTLLLQMTMNVELP